MQNKVTHKVTFPNQMYTLLTQRTKQLGISVPEYLRFLVITDTKPFIDSIPMVDIETEKAIGKALTDYKAGRYDVIKNENDLKKYMDQFRN
jgi:hypothetical protein